MPRETYEKSILEAFARLNNGRAVARELNIHENTVYQALKGHRGVCWRCGKSVSPGKKGCVSCLESDRKRVLETRRERTRLGLCLSCDQVRSPISRQFCAEHRIKNHDYHAKRERGKPNKPQKARSLRYRYGENGEKAWLRDLGVCRTCETTNNVHIHHIDENKQNNSLENLICLCFFCHKAVHALINLRNRKGLIVWFSQTYTDKPLT
jgi:hypothetical protein